MKIEIKTHYTDWQEVDEATAREFAEWLMDHIVTIPRERRADYIRERYVRGIEL